MTKAPFSGKGERASDLLGLIHSDVCGPMNTQARAGYQYFITFTDDFSRYGYIYLMRHKSEALERFKEFKNEVQNQHGKSIKALRSDRGGEYLSQDFDELLKGCGIVSQLTPPDTPQWNGVSERRNRTLLDMVRSMMSHTDLPTSFWGYALETAAFTLNRVPSKSVQKTPHEMWTGRRPNMSFMKIWGCKAYVKHQMSTKLEPKSEKCTFVGYPKETKPGLVYATKTHEQRDEPDVIAGDVDSETELPPPPPPPDRTAPARAARAHLSKSASRNVAVGKGLARKGIKTRSKDDQIQTKPALVDWMVCMNNKLLSAIPGQDKELARVSDTKNDSGVEVQWRANQAFDRSSETPTQPVV
ncbi:hypothetical protein V6N11_045338 [Hibiscus sabdariffa]|uniref:Integrase catalytic domain-containing protein n=1 Tax=Hibiscus sabdariffa TaxID=183260 RepID=A0ABR2Q0M6_9ROSI